jgi:hypothetical protein
MLATTPSAVVVLLDIYNNTIKNVEEAYRLFENKLDGVIKVVIN